MSIHGLTGSLHGDVQLATAGPFGVDFQISHFLHPQTLRLETPTRGPAGVGITGWSAERKGGD